MDKFVVKSKHPQPTLKGPMKKKKIGAMDKFLIKSPREPAQAETVTRKTANVAKQSTIYALPNVVVIEDIERMKVKLKHPNQSKTILLQSLKELGKKIPPRHVLQSTKIGHTVSKLRKHEDKEVSKEAKRVYTKWKNHFVEFAEKPKIEVRCDKKSEDMRLRGKTFLSDALGLESQQQLVEAIEREAFHTHGRRVTHGYRRSMRNFVMKLKGSEQLRAQVIDGTLTVEEFVKQLKKS